MSAAIRIDLSDDVRKAIDAAPHGADFLMLQLAADFYVRNQRAMTLDELQRAMSEQRPIELNAALATIRIVSKGIEALG